MEIRDLYNADRQRTGQTIIVGDPIPAGSYVQVVMVFIQNSGGYFLIQKRAKSRNGMYATTGGHPKSGQTSLEGIVTEIKEELGIDVDPSKLKLFYSGRSDEEQVFFDDYYLRADFSLNTLKLQKEEVQFTEWLMPGEIKALFKRGKFMANHYEEYLRLRAWLKEQHIIRKNQKKLQKKRAKPYKKFVRNKD